MVESRGWVWSFFYLLASVLAPLVAFVFGVGIFLPGERLGERSNGPLEQRFYLLLVNQGHWMSGTPHGAEFSEGMTKEGRARFSRILNEIIFREDCLGQDGTKTGNEMACVVNGEDINFVDY